MCSLVAVGGEGGDGESSESSEGGAGGEGGDGGGVGLAALSLMTSMSVETTSCHSIFVRSCSNSVQMSEAIFFWLAGCGWFLVACGTLEVLCFKVKRPIRRP